jgi:hypothetical protein
MGDPAPPPQSNRRTGGGASLYHWLALLVATIGVAGLLLIARGLTMRPSPIPDKVGSLLAVTLTNGTVYFGRLTAEPSGSIVLTGVFQAVTRINQQTKQQTAQLVARKTNDWHGPLDMTIPLDRILIAETVDPASTVGKALTAAPK